MESSTPIKKEYKEYNGPRRAFPVVLKYSKKENKVVTNYLKGKTLHECAEERRAINGNLIFSYSFPLIDSFLDYNKNLGGKCKIKEKEDVAFKITTALPKAVFDRIIETIKLHGLFGIGRLINNLWKHIPEYIEFMRFYSDNPFTNFNMANPEFFVKKLRDYTFSLRYYKTKKKFDELSYDYLLLYYSRLVKRYINFNDFPACILEDGFPWHVKENGFIDPDRICYGSFAFHWGHTFLFQSVYSKLNNPHWSLSTLIIAVSRRIEKLSKKVNMEVPAMNLELFVNSSYFCGIYGNLRMINGILKKKELHHQLLTEEEAKERIEKILKSVQSQLNTLALFDKYARSLKQLFWNLEIFTEDKENSEKEAEAEVSISFDIPPNISITKKSGEEKKLSTEEVVELYIGLISKDFDILKKRVKVGVKRDPRLALAHLYVRSKYSKIKCLEDLCFGPGNILYTSSWRHYIPEDTTRDLKIRRDMVPVYRYNEQKLGIDAIIDSRVKGPWAMVDMFHVKNIRIVEGKNKTENKENIEELLDRLKRWY